MKFYYGNLNKIVEDPHLSSAVTVHAIHSDGICYLIYSRQSPRAEG